MSYKRFRVVSLSRDHGKSVRNQFSSGSEQLDTYFKQQVTQDIKRSITRCFVALTSDDRIAGYYTLASASINLQDLPEELQKKLPRYPSVPAVRMGRLAVDQNFQGQGLGGALLADALKRLCNASTEIGVYALLVDAKNKTAANFYLHHGFIQLTNDPTILFLPLKTASDLLIEIP